MNTKLATAQIRVKNWAAIIQERNESGLSVKDYCTASAFMRLLLLLAPQSERGPACRKRLC
mgnify:CR=1 FL=1